MGQENLSYPILKHIIKVIFNQNKGLQSPKLDKSINGTKKRLNSLKFKVVIMRENISKHSKMDNEQIVSINI